MGLRWTKSPEGGIKANLERPYWGGRVLLVSVLNWRQALKGHEAVVEEAVVEEAVAEEAVVEESVVEYV